jgi:hypothetical protein
LKQMYSARCELGRDWARRRPTARSGILVLGNGDLANRRRL